MLTCSRISPRRFPPFPIPLLLTIIAVILAVPAFADPVVWSDDFSDGDIGDWTRGQNGQQWTVVNGELLQPDYLYQGNTVLIYEPIPWGNYSLEFDVRPIAKRDALGPVIIMQSGPANPNFDWDCTLDMIDQRSPITMCAELGRTYHVRIETIAGTARWYVDGTLLVEARYDRAYSAGFVRIETDNTSAAFDNFVLRRGRGGLHH
jgi:hypothetical protein